MKDSGYSTRIYLNLLLFALPNLKEREGVQIVCIFELYCVGKIQKDDGFLL